jgi:hypothetical protein
MAGDQIVDFQPILDRLNALFKRAAVVFLGHEKFPDLRFILRDASYTL